MKKINKELKIIKIREKEILLYKMVILLFYVYINGLIIKDDYVIV